MMFTFGLSMTFLLFCTSLRNVHSYVCYMGQQPDPSRGPELRWVLPYSNDVLCGCTRILRGGVNIIAPEGAEDHFYVDNPWVFFNNDGVHQLQKLLGCTPQEDAEDEKTSPVGQATDEVTETAATKISTEIEGTIPAKGSSDDPEKTTSDKISTQSGSSVPTRESGDEPKKTTSSKISTESENSVPTSESSDEPEKTPSSKISTESESSVPTRESSDEPGKTTSSNISTESGSSVPTRERSDKSEKTTSNKISTESGSSVPTRESSDGPEKATSSKISTESASSVSTRESSDESEKTTSSKVATKKESSVPTRDSSDEPEKTTSNKISIESESSVPTGESSDEPAKTTSSKISAESGSSVPGREFIDEPEKTTNSKISAESASSVPTRESSDESEKTTSSKVATIPVYGLEIIGGFTHYRSLDGKTNYVIRYEWGLQSADQVEEHRIFKSYCSIDSRDGHCHLNFYISSVPSTEHYEIIGSYVEVESTGIKAFEWGDSSVDDDGQEDVVVTNGKLDSGQKAMLHFILEKSNKPTKWVGFILERCKKDSPTRCEPSEERLVKKNNSSSHRYRLVSFNCWTQEWGGNSMCSLDILVST